MADDDSCPECAQGCLPHQTDGYWLHYQTCVDGLVGTFPCRDRLDWQSEDDADAQTSG